MKEVLKVFFCFSLITFSLNSAFAKLNNSTDCVAYKNESILCSAEGKSYLKGKAILDRQPIKYDYSASRSVFSGLDANYHYSGPEEWSEFYIQTVAKTSFLKSDALLKDDYLQLIDYIKKNNLVMSTTNRVLHKADQRQSCGMMVYLGNHYRNFNTTANDPDSDFPRVNTPFQAVKFCNESDFKLLNCGFNFEVHDTYPEKSFRWLLGVCKEKFHFKGSIDEILGNHLLANSTANPPTQLPVSYLEAWDNIQSSTTESLIQISSIKSVFSQLNIEWLNLAQAGEFGDGAYSNHNRIIAPLFFHAAAYVEKIELAKRTKFKIDLLNSFDLIFSIGPTILNDKKILEKAQYERAEIRRLIEAI